MATNHGSIEFLKFPNPSYPGDASQMIKKWLRDSWARRKIVALQQAVAAIVVPTKTSDLTNDSGYITSSDIPTIPSASTANPQMDGTASAGTSSTWSRGDHVHPTDTSRQAALSTAQMNAVNSGITAAKVTAYDAISVPTAVSELTNDSGYQTSSDVSDAISAEAGLLVPYGYCSTAAATAAKTVTVSPTVTALTAGLIIAVKFQYANTVASPTLNVNGLGAKAIKRYGTTAAGITPGNSWQADSVVMLVYDGTGWLLCDWNNTIYYGITDDEYIEGTSTVNKLITAARLKAAILYHAPVKSVNGETGDVTVAVPSATSDLTNDSGFITSASVPDASSATPAMDGTGAAGSSADYARADHVHPHDSSKADKATTLAGYGITNAYTKTEVDGMIPTIPTNVSAFTNDAGYITASKFSVITCTLSSSNSYGGYTALPSGFTYGSCVILSVQVPDGSGERVGQGIFTTSNMRLFAEVSANGVRVYNNTSRYYGADVKVTLMRTDI